MKKLLLLSIILCSCKPQYETKSHVESFKNTESLISQTYVAHEGYYNRLRTIKHDNHLFISETSNSGRAILHHPDCPCQKK